MELSRHKGTGAFLERTGTRPLTVRLILTCVMLLVSMCCIRSPRRRGVGGREAFASHRSQIKVLEK